MLDRPDSVYRLGGVPLSVAEVPARRLMHVPTLQRLCCEIVWSMPREAMEALLFLPAEVQDRLRKRPLLCASGADTPKGFQVFHLDVFVRKARHAPRPLMMPSTFDPRRHVVDTGQEISFWRLDPVPGQGNWVVLVGDTLTVWDVAARQLVSRLPTFLSSLPNTVLGATVAALSEHILVVCAFPAGDLHAFLTPDGALVAVAIDIRTNAIVQRYHVPADVYRPRNSYNSRLLLVGGGCVLVSTSSEGYFAFDALSGQSFPLPVNEEARGPIHAATEMAFPGVAMAGPRSLFVVNVTTGLLYHPPQHVDFDVRCVTKVDRSHVAIGGRNNRLYLLHCLTGMCVRRFDIPEGHHVALVHLLPDGCIAAAASCPFEIPTQRVIHLLDQRTGSLLATVTDAFLFTAVVPSV